MLLSISRTTLTAHLSGRPVPDAHSYPLTAGLKKNRGVFVTLKKKASGDLRGCIGYIVAAKPLAEAVIDCTLQAATKDRRFSPMKNGEDRSVFIELSVLSPPRQISSVEEIKIGRHGLIISKGAHSGVLLPQVPVEQGWSRQDFLKAVCTKASLPEGAWQNGAALYVFTARVFGEHRPL